MRTRLPASPGLPSVLWLLLLAAPAAHAQEIFVTPVADAPFTATVQVERTVIRPDGQATNLHSNHQIARDSQGRIRNEMSLAVPVGSQLTPELLRVHLYDPITRLNTFYELHSRIFWTETARHPPSTEPPVMDEASPSSDYKPANQFTHREDLGTQELEGVRVRGVRETQTIPAATSGTGKDVEVVDEYWYSPDLRINLAMRHTDQSGSKTIAVTGVVRKEPDPTLFRVPEGYTPPKPVARPTPTSPTVTPQN